jgi:hypothetical protein
LELGTCKGRPDVFSRVQPFLDRLGYEYTEDTANPAYDLFLS